MTAGAPEAVQAAGPALRELKHPELRKVWNSIRSGPLAPPSAALLLIDFQRLTCDPQVGLGLRLRETGEDHVVAAYYAAVAKSAANAARLLAACRDAGLAVVHTHLACATDDGRDVGGLMRGHGLWARKGSAEAAFIAPLQPTGHELVLPRTTFSVFTPWLGDQLLKNLGISTLVIAGVGTDASVASSTRDAADRGYNTILVEDACAALDPQDHRATIDFLQLWYCDVADTERVAAAVRRKAEVA